MTGTTRPVSLNDLLTLQGRLMEVLGVELTSGTIRTANQASQTELGAAIGISVESSEILAELDKANRKWKMNGEQIAPKVEEELIDVIFFVLELAILLDLSGEDLARLYLHKYKKNLLRLLQATATKTGGVDGRLVTLLDEHFGETETERIIKEVLAKKEV